MKQEMIVRNQATKPSSREELYESIVHDIRNMYGSDLPEAEAHTAARNLIEFCKILLEGRK